MTRGRKLPHYRRERELMQSGEKRLAYFYSTAADINDFRNDGGFVEETFHDNNITRVLIYRPGNAHLAHCFVRAHRMHRAGLISAETAHARCGVLLGYSKADMKRFISRGEPLQ